METELLRKLKAGLEEEIKSYKSMLKISLDEQTALQKETYSRELISLASEKLRLMNRINQISSLLNPLKAMWVQERERRSSSPMEKEIAPLISYLGNILEELLTVDSKNTRKLADLTETDWFAKVSNKTEKNAAAQAQQKSS